MICSLIVHIILVIVLSIWWWWRRDEAKNSRLPPINWPSLQTKDEESVDLQHDHQTIFAREKYVHMTDDLKSNKKAYTLPVTWYTNNEMVT